MRMISKCALVNIRSSITIGIALFKFLLPGIVIIKNPSNDKYAIVDLYEKRFIRKVCTTFVLNRSKEVRISQISS